MTTSDAKRLTMARPYYAACKKALMSSRVRLWLSAGYVVVGLYVEHAWDLKVRYRLLFRHPIDLFICSAQVTMTIVDKTQKQL